MPRSNEDWVALLSTPHDEKAISELRAILIRGLKPALNKYVDRDPDAFVEDVAQDALLKILDNIHTFKGESRFHAWALKIAVREGLSELRRKKWSDISINDLAGSKNEDNREITDHRFASSDPAPDRVTHEGMMLNMVLTMIDEELSDKQKMAITSLMIHNMPISVVAEQMGVKRNALYKLVHDARLNLKNKMREKGINTDVFLNEM
ncbi:MAG: RNA polymerase sigma factor [Cyclonatronaceae bacterium]